MNELGIKTKVNALTGLCVAAALIFTLGLLWLMHVDGKRYEATSTLYMRQIELARIQQVNFKKQVQEWKDTLIRGHDAEDFEKYHGLFLEQESLVQENGEALEGLLTQPSIRAKEDEFLKAHEELGRRYRSALVVFEQSGRLDIQSTDHMVRGMDRDPTDLIDGIADSIDSDFDHYMALHNAILINQQFYVLLTALIVFSGLMVAGMMIATRITRPIYNLSQTVSKVSSEHDYSLRALRSSRDELGLLTDGFNEMLTQVQLKDAALQKTNEALKAEISERQSAKGQLERLRDEHEAVLNSVGVGVHCIDLDGRITYENPAAAKMLGYEISDLIGKPAHQTIHHTRADGTAYPVGKCHIYATLRDGGMHRISEEVFWRKDGTSIPVEYTSTPIRDENGQIVGAAVVFTDLTERQRIEARLLQSQKMKMVGTLAGGVAHEFNSILTAIIGQSELLLSEFLPDDPLGKNVREIRHAADRAAILTRQLLAYGRKQILQPKILDLNRILTDMASTLQFLMGKEVVVRIIPAVGLKTVKIDPGQIQQVVVNLVMNAADAMPNGGQLTLETANVTLDEGYVPAIAGLKPGGYVMLAITDTGVGMNDEVKARVFEPFFSTKGVGQGTGLGLATCYGILKQSDGHINVYSELGRGTTFKIYLPQVDQLEETPPPRTTPLDMPRGTETILLAEDDPSLLEMAATLLRRLGYTVHTATNGIEAMGMRHQKGIGHIDLLFTDVVMPHMTGKELSDRIRASYPRIKILFTSAYTESAIVHQGILNEGVTLLQKPFTPSALAHKVREVLDQ